jgi:methylated-DNA-[protein]-cysteine S-methyltransferase
MDALDTTLTQFFAPAAPAGLGRRLLSRARGGAGAGVAALAERFTLQASDAGIRRLGYGRGRDVATRGGRRHLARARRELAEYLAGARSFFTVPLDLAGLPPFQARVLAAAARVPFGEVTSYAELARAVGHPRAARAVGNALGANPVPIIVPCHRIVRGDGSWGHYAFGGALKTRLLALERATPTLVGSASTRIVCRRGCPHAARIGPAREIVFATLDDARSVGYRRCRVCRPAA